MTDSPQNRYPDISDEWLVEDKARNPPQQVRYKESGKTARKLAALFATSEIYVKKRPQKATHRRKDSTHIRHYSPEHNRHRERKHSKDEEVISRHRETPGQENLQSYEDLDKPMKSLLPGMCMLGALRKNRNKPATKRKPVVTIVYDRDKLKRAKERKESHRENYIKTKKKSAYEHLKSNKAKKPSTKHPITLPVSHVKIVKDGHHRREFRKWDESKEDVAYKNENRFGERCRHEDCERMRSPASLWDMLTKTRSPDPVRTEPHRRHERSHPHHYHQRHQRNSSEESVIYQKFAAKDRDRYHRHAARKDEHVRYGRGYLVDSDPHHGSHDDDDQLQTRRHRHSKDHNHHHSRNHNHYHWNADHRTQPKQPVRIKRRGLLSETSSTDSSSEALVIAKPKPRSHIPKPQSRLGFIEADKKRRHVTLHDPSGHGHRHFRRPESSRFHTAAAKDSHRRKQHAALVREALKLNRVPSKNDVRSQQVDAKVKKKRAPSSESSSSKSSTYSNSHFVASAPEKARREPTLAQAHTQAKSLGRPSTKKKGRVMPRISRRLLTSSDSKSSAGYEQFDVKDFVDFLATLSRNTVGTLTNKRKALRLYRSYLTGEKDVHRLRK